eukprot:Selendium_serpulae@DN4654_c0_g1_i2.p1
MSPDFSTGPSGSVPQNQGRSAAKPSNKHGLSQEEVKRGLEAAERHKRAHEMWQTWVPERQWGLTSPAFWVLLVLVAILHYHNVKNDRIQELDTTIDANELARREEVKRKRQKRLEQNGQE